MLARRVIACLDVQDGRVVKGTRFTGLRDAGDPAELAREYERDGADEVVLLDVAATPRAGATRLDVVRQVAAAAFIPLTLGGGIRSVEDVARALRAGADKVAVNSAFVSRPALIEELAARFGAQCVVAAIDARRAGDRWIVVTHGGRRDTALDAVAWARDCAARGAGEILLTSVDRDGTRDGYDVALTRAVAAAVRVPVIASGGAGDATHVAEVLTAGHADAALLARILHDRTAGIGAIKRALAARGLLVRAA